MIKIIQTSFILFLFFQIGCYKPYEENEICNFKQEIISKKEFVDSMKIVLKPTYDTIYWDFNISKEDAKIQYSYAELEVNEKRVLNMTKYLSNIENFMLMHHARRSRDEFGEPLEYYGSTLGKFRIIEHISYHLIDSVHTWSEVSAPYDNSFVLMKKLLIDSLKTWHLKPNDGEGYYDRFMLTTYFGTYFSRGHLGLLELLGEKYFSYFFIPDNGYLVHDYNHSIRLCDGIMTCWLAEVLKSNDGKLQVKNDFIRKIRKKDVIGNIEDYYKTTEHYQRTLNTLQDKSTNAFSCAGLNDKQVTEGFTWSETESAYIVSWPIMKIETQYQIALKNMLQSIKLDSEETGQDFKRIFFHYALLYL